jgi:hypothetical protein
MYVSSNAGDLRMAVKHRGPAPARYTWEIFRDHEILPIEQSHDRFGSWAQASEFGKNALKRLSAAKFGRAQTPVGRPANVIYEPHVEPPSYNIV